MDPRGQLFGLHWFNMEVKLAAPLGALEQSPFFGIFVDLRKAYNAMD